MEDALNLLPSAWDIPLMTSRITLMWTDSCIHGTRSLSAWHPRYPSGTVFKNSTFRFGFHEGERLLQPERIATCSCPHGEDAASTSGRLRYCVRPSCSSHAMAFWRKAALVMLAGGTSASRLPQDGSADPFRCPKSLSNDPSARTSRTFYRQSNKIQHCSSERLKRGKP